MSDYTVSFANPPVIERVIGIQFEPVGLTSGHLGWFWKRCLGDEWTSTDDAPPLPDQFEAFGKRGAINLPRLRFEQRASVPANRMRIHTRDESRLLQIQDTRFVFNWVKKGDDYPRFPIILDEFDRWFTAFREFSEACGLAPVKPNQWEATYVNRIRAGELWGEPSDWPNVIPGLLLSIGNYGGTRFEQMSGEWTSEIPERQGRLHIEAQYQARAEEQALVLNLTARGPVASIESVRGKLELGHDTIVSAFDQITSEKAHEVWRKESHGNRHS